MRDKLLEFHRNWYSSNIMSLCVIGSEDIETLEKWVVEKFSPVVNKEVVVPDLCVEKPFNPEDLGKIVKFVPIKDKDVLTLFYSLPYCQKEFKTRPLDYLSNIIGHEGENSLLSYLKAEDLALELSSSPDHSMDAMTTFEIEITLTKKGLQNYETVIEATYQYLNELRKKGPSEEFYNDQKNVGEMDFMFADKKENID
jgi:insulysin